jgi:hypothetical protein
MFCDKIQLLRQHRYAACQSANFSTPLRGSTFCRVMSVRKVHTGLRVQLRVRCGLLRIFKRNYGYVDVSRTRCKAHQHANAQMAHRRVGCI